MSVAVGVIFGIFTNPAYTIPEIWANFGNMHPSGTPIWSFMFITVACGVSPASTHRVASWMARMKSERRLLFSGGFTTAQWSARASSL